VYIARTEGSPCGTLSWRFDCADVGVKMKAVSVTTHSQTFNSGTVVWRMRSGQAVTEFLGGMGTL
jgi:peptide-N4-(N-acetyl-beta-glucosaminyl)asparagine amidase